ncbi:hypothetical protein BEWA_015650 [Theileria equi strain WA]|uniref:Uncharacterized protein n=1 Tax=Theileria equi strain WA TaxID=1537102 RepID=L1LCJ8_THEEQ|nr:hypothetical protein BEWA_015650 [Theileria equi strain WA]EKX73004.1 hypothetical protein BEWA_015650 [Theileria equi strain WA]|eukprot:XP_004832456.1 hypothetical protein BEWA_015650 [Theileria equi strain WA]
MNKGKTVDIDIGKKAQKGNGVEQDENGYHYTSSNGGTVNLTDDWFPEPEGTYRKFTHTPKGGKIGSINSGNQGLNTFTGLATYNSVSVFYWSDDNTFRNPLLIQLGSENDDYYTDPEGDNTWSKQSGVHNGTLRKTLDKENCKRNYAHVLDISKKNNTNYNCPSCDTGTKINVSYSSVASIISSAYTIPGARSPFSVTSFKNDNNWQAGLPSLKDVKNVKVIWSSYVGNNKPLLSVTPQTGNKRYFRRNAENGNAWIEVTASQSSLPNGETPTLATLDLSRHAGTYTNGDVKITVRVSHIGDGYYRYQYSLCGGPFRATKVQNNSSTLSGIEYLDGTLDSISAYYFGSTTEPPNLLLVELRSQGGKNYNYFCRETKDAHTWSPCLGSGGETGKQLVGSSLKQTLDAIRKVQFPDPPKSIGQQILDFLNSTSGKITEGVTGGLATVGLGGLGIWKGPALIAKLIARL